MSYPSYVLITAARDEADNIERTIQSVIAQTVLPLRWTIVSDGSTDGTDDIVMRYAVRYDWIELFRRPDNEERNFASKTQSVEQAYHRLAGIEFDVLGNVDADISFPPDYMEYLLTKLAESPELGIVGTPYVEEGFHSWTDTLGDPRDIPGACQLFRRACWEAIGGYLHIKGGGEDWAAVRTAWFKGWETRSWPERTCVHHRRHGTGRASVWKSRMHYGTRDYSQGNPAAWEVLRALYHMKNKPYVLGGALIFAGYLSAWIRRANSPLPPEVVAVHRADQQARLRAMFRKAFRISRILHSSRKE